MESWHNLIKGKLSVNKKIPVESVEFLITGKSAILTNDAEKIKA